MPNHILVNKIMNYPISHFIYYTALVCIEMHKRGYKVNTTKFCLTESCTNIAHDEVFENWHNDRYMEQCYFNLQEKWDCGGVLEDEWEKFEQVYMNERYNYSEEDWEEVQKKGKLMPWMHNLEYKIK